MSQSISIPGSPENRPPTRKWNPWPAAIIAWFVLFIGATAGFIVFAARTQKMDLVAPDYYSQEIHFQAQLDRAQRAHQLDQGLTMEHDPGRRELRIALPPDHAQAGATGRIHFYRPSAAQLDRTIPLSAGTNGAQVVSTASLETGLWKVRVFWTANDQEFYSDKNLVIPQGPAAARHD